MKKILIIISVFVFLASCEKFDDMNKERKNPVQVTGESLFTGAQKNLFDQMVSTNVNQNIFRLFAQHWTETTYFDESRYDLVTRTIPDNHWDVMYRDVLRDLKEAKTVISSTNYTMDPIDEVAARKQNRLATVEILSIYAWGQLVETFGNIPYTDALDINKPEPKYDDALGIYKDLIVRLDAAITTINTNLADGVATGIGDCDNMYQGDLVQWVKFANCLKLKMGILLAEVDEPLSRATVESAVDNLKGGVFTSNADNARLPYMDAAPNTNPLYQDLVASGRHDFVPANTLVDYMNLLEDPRREFYFTLFMGDTTYKGGLYGQYNRWKNYSHIDDQIKEPTFEGTIFDYVEVEFYLAEAVERGYNVGGTAEGHYNNAITQSFNYWAGVNGTTVHDTVIANYLSNPLVAYNAAEWKKSIGNQRWIALYNRGFEAWTSWRMMDYPELLPPPNAFSDVPVRLTYPIAEQTLNGVNYNAAAAALVGGDKVSSKLFFDKH